MLKKLLKYDLKNVLKIIVVFYILSLFFAILTRILSIFDNSMILGIIGKVTMGITISMLVSALINTLMRVWVRFKNNLYGDESYLTHTLPVSKQNLYLSKVLTSIISSFLTILVIAISLLIMFYSKENMEVLRGTLKGVAVAFSSTTFEFVTVMGIILFLEILIVILIGNFGIILGHRGNNKLVMSIAYAFITYMGTQIFIFLTLLVAGLFNSNIMELFTSNNPDIETTKLIFYILGSAYLVCNIAYYILGSKLLSKGVNVD